MFQSTRFTARYFVSRVPVLDGRLPLSPEMDGSGMYFNASKADESNMLDGMIFPGNGSRTTWFVVGSVRVLAGLYICCGRALKSPFFIAAVGTVKATPSGAMERCTSSVEKNNSLFFLIGPPRVPPNMCWRSTGVVREKAFMASRTSFRK